MIRNMTKIIDWLPHKVTKSIFFCFLTVVPILFNNVSAKEIAEFGVLHLTITDAETGEVTPARIEVLNDSGESFIAIDALPVAVGHIDPNEDAVLVNESFEVALSRFGKTTRSPYTGKEQFYSIGESVLKLPVGIYKIRAFKGPEYIAGFTDIKIEKVIEKKKEIKLRRFANMPAQGWYSSDDHLHLSRTHKGVDPLILKQMQAEDIHVGNILQMGRSHSFSITPQYAHGPESLYQEGDHLIITGQENLRTHIFGHTITLGAKEPIRDNDNYLIYRLFWEKAIKQGGINGYAHWGNHQAYNYVPSSGMPLVAPHNMMHFIEVLQANRIQYDAWYDMLNLGFRIAPTAGTDYSGAYGFPGDVRFYTRVDGSLTYEKWLDSVRKGRTFVTTGPLLSFRVNGKDMGEEIILPEVGSVTVEGEVRYDPEKDISESKNAVSNDARELFDNQENGYVIGLELVENGNVVRRFARVNDNGFIKFKINHEIKKSSWLSLRTINITSVETKNSFPNTKKAAIAHTAPIYITVKNTPPISAQPQAKATARAWLASLDLLEEKFKGDNIYYMKNFGITLDLVSEEMLLGNRLAIMEEIETARRFFESYLE